MSGIVKHKGDTYAVGERNSLIKLPKTARTTRQRVEFLLKKGYVWAAFMLASHSNKVLVSLLQRTHPDVPWKNIHFASKHA